MVDAPIALERVVVGIDFSARSVAAAAWTVRCLVRDAELVLVHATGGGARASVSVLPSASAALPRADLERAELKLRESARELIADFIWCEARDGDPANAILGAAAEFRADLVVVGAPEASPDCRHPHDATVERLISHSELPLIVATGRMQHRPRRIAVLADDAALIPTTAARCAWALAAAHEADVAVLSPASAGFASAATAGWASRIPRHTGGEIEPDLIVAGAGRPFDSGPAFGGAHLGEALRSAACPLVFAPECVAIGPMH